LKSLVEAAIPAVAITPAANGTFDLATVAVGSAITLRVRPGTAPAFGLDQALHPGSDSGAINTVRVEGREAGTYGNHVVVDTTASTSGSPSTFNFVVRQNGAPREIFPNLSSDPANARYFETIVNDPKSGSHLVRLVDLLLPGSPAPAAQTLALTGGDDGLLGLTDSDFSGSPLGKTGLQALNGVQDLALVLVPGRATPAVHTAMIQYCEGDRNGMAFAVLDPPAGASAIEMIAYVETTANLLGLSEYAAIYWPRLTVLNPSRPVFGPIDTVVVPPSGIVCGVYARTDGARPGGIYDPPAGIEKGRLIGVVGFETDEVLEEKKRDLVYPKRINPLTTGTGLPRYIDGSRTLKGDGNFPYVGERRGVIFIEKSLRLGLQFARHRNNTEGLRAQVRRTINGFLFVQMNNGAFRSRSPKTAYFIDVSDALNPPSVIFAGQLIARVGLATNKPAEFVILRISQDTRALEAEFAGSGAP
jgi:hypothetical protein